MLYLHRFLTLYPLSKLLVCLPDGRTGYVWKHSKQRNYSCLLKKNSLSLFLSLLKDVRLGAVTEHMASISRNDLTSICILFNDLLSTV
jgi:hypothetical protein